MSLRRVIPAVFVCLLPRFALAQSSFVAPDGKSRYPGVTVWCPNGTGVTACNFGGGGGGAGGSSVSITTGGSAVSTSNRFPVSDPALDTLISGGALTIGGSVSIAGSPTVAIGAGSAAIGSVSVSNFPATQAVSAVSLPLPAGAATSAAQAAPLGPVAPGTATATSSVVIGCLSNTTLPSFSAGQQGAVPCDGSGRPYVVTVPSATNVPTYLQAVSSGGATVFRAINAAASTMAANIKSGSGLIYGYEACNSGTNAAYLRIFGLTTTPVPGTSTPLISKLLPAGVCAAYSSTVGLALPNGIGIDATSGSMADSDSTAIATANQVSVEVYYK